MRVAADSVDQLKRCALLVQLHVSSFDTQDLGVLQAFPGAWTLLLAP